MTATDGPRNDTTTRFRAAGLVVDPASRRIERDGREIGLEPRAFDVLVFLAAQHGRVVSKDELLAAVWIDRIVTDDAVYRAIRLARNAFGENGTDILQTVHGRGYRCNALIEPAPAEVTGARRTRPILMLGASAAAVALLVIALWWPTAAEDPSSSSAAVAVLPFEAADPDAQPRFLGTELAAEVIGDLARLPGLVVIGPASSFADASPSELGIDSLVTGTWLRVDGRLLVHAELHDVVRDRLIWSGEFDDVRGSPEFEALRSRLGLAAR